MKGSVQIRRLGACFVVPFLALAGCDDDPTSDDADPPASVLSFDGFAEVGESIIVRTSDGVNYSLATTGLEPGHAYTLWIVIFNEPSECLEPSELPTFCGPSDVVNDLARPDMMYATGLTAGESGEATFEGRRLVGDTGGSINGPVGLPAYGLENPAGAEIQLVVHDHGPMMPTHMPDMIETVDGGCSDAGIPGPGADSPWNNHEFGSRGPNTCQSIQFAAHPPP